MILNKKDTRSYYKKLRGQLSYTELKLNSQGIHDQLFSRLMMHRYSPIHVFLPIIDKHEINTYLIINTLLKDFAPDIYLPIIKDDGELIHQKYDQSVVLKTNALGISEPELTHKGMDSEHFFKAFSKEDILVLIPLLGFDKTGHRVGYGKGYYDRFLGHATEQTCKVGLSVFDPIEAISDTSIHDIKLDFCICPNRVWSW